jgi:hypothetical protein
MTCTTSETARKMTFLTATITRPPRPPRVIWLRPHQIWPSGSPILPLPPRLHYRMEPTLLPVNRSPQRNLPHMRPRPAVLLTHTQGRPRRRQEATTAISLANTPPKTPSKPASDSVCCCPTDAHAFDAPVSKYPGRDMVHAEEQAVRRAWGAHRRRSVDNHHP